MKQRYGRCEIPRPSDPELEMLPARPHTPPQNLAKGNKNNVSLSTSKALKWLQEQVKNNTGKMEWPNVQTKQLQNRKGAVLSGF